MLTYFEALLVCLSIAVPIMYSSTLYGSLCNTVPSDSLNPQSRVLVNPVVYMCRSSYLQPLRNGYIQM